MNGTPKVQGNRLGDCVSALTQVRATPTPRGGPTRHISLRQNAHGGGRAILCTRDACHTSGGCARRKSGNGRPNSIPRADIVKLNVRWPDPRARRGGRQPFVLIVPGPTAVSFPRRRLTLSTRQVWGQWRSPSRHHAAMRSASLFS